LFLIVIAAATAAAVRGDENIDADLFLFLIVAATAVRDNVR